MALAGGYLTGLTAVTFGGTPATGITADHAGQARCTVPPRGVPAPVAVAATTPAGTGTLPGGFTYTPPPAPVITAITPAAGPVDTTGQMAEITGTGLASVTGVRFGPLAAPFTITDAGRISVEVPRSSIPGTVPVQVSNPWNTATLDSGWTWTP